MRGLHGHITFGHVTVKETEFDSLTSVTDGYAIALKSAKSCSIKMI